MASRGYLMELKDFNIHHKSFSYDIRNCKYFEGIKKKNIKCKSYKLPHRASICWMCEFRTKGDKING